jgi:hypothetical protein
MARLQSRGDAVLARLAAKARVVADLRAGRLTLPQAAARFRRLNDAPCTDLARRLRGATEEERLCRQVIRWAESTAQGESPGEAEQTRDGLEAELDGLLARTNGNLRLSE